jgi:DNA-binding MarR family transcriptional regulator
MLSNAIPTNTAAAMRETVGQLSAAVRSSKWDLIDLEVENILGMTVDLIADGDAEGLRAAYEEVERLYATTRPIGAEEEQGNAVMGQLRALTTLFAVASSKPGRVEIEKLAGRHKAILLELLDSQEALENGAIAARTGHDEAVVSRVLRELRSAGLVATRREWRRKLSELTARGREIASTLPRDRPRLEDVPVLLAKSIRPDPGPLDVWALANRVGAEVSTASNWSEPNHELVEVVDRAGRLCIKISGFSEARARYHLALGLGRLAVFRNLDHQNKNGMVECGLGSVPQRDTIYAHIIASALLMPELPTTAACMKAKNIREVADMFNVPEELARKRVLQLGFMVDCTESEEIISATSSVP